MCYNIDFSLYLMKTGSYSTLHAPATKVKQNSLIISSEFIYNQTYAKYNPGD